MNLRQRARGRHVPGAMNRLESAYARDVLEPLKIAGDIVWWGFDCFKLRLAAKTFYTPDFLVMTKTCDLEIHETKGFMEDDAAVKIKVAAALYPFFRFVLVTHKNKTVGWQYRDVSA